MQTDTWTAVAIALGVLTVLVFVSVNYFQGRSIIQLSGAVASFLSTGAVVMGIKIIYASLYVGMGTEITNGDRTTICLGGLCLCWVGIDALQRHLFPLFGGGSGP